MDIKLYQKKQLKILVFIYQSSLNSAKEECVRPKMQSEREFKANCRLAAQIIASNRQYQHKSEQERNQILQNRLKKFYSPQQIDVAEEHFANRVEPCYEEGVLTSTNTLIVFGTDFLSVPDLKRIFGPKSGRFKEIYLNPSNVMLQYDSPQEAREVILRNVKKDSETKYKVEEDSTLQQKRPSKLPKEWIQLDPYDYVYFYKGKESNPDCFEKYKRKLQVRYATNRESILGKSSFNHIEELYQRCKKIWTVQAQKHNLLKEIIHKKLQEFKKKKDQLTKNYNKMVSEQGSQHGRSRSRNKEKEKNALEKSILLGDEDDIEGKKGKYRENQRENLNESNLAIGEEENLERRLRGSSVSSELEGLIRNIEDINLNFDQMDERLSSHEEQFMGQEGKQDFEGILNELGKLQFDGLRAQFIQLPYKTAVPIQMRGEKDPNAKFKYENYLEKTQLMEKRLKKYCEIDLTDD